MPRPTKKSQPRAGAASSISTSNETSFAFLGARRPSWMTSGAPATPGPSSNDAGSARADARAARHAKQPTKTSTNRHALSGGAVPVDAQATPEGAQEPVGQPNDIASSSAVVLPSPALSSELSSAASTPLPAESTSYADDSSGTAQQTYASAAGGTLPTTSQIQVPLSAPSNIEPIGATPQPVAKDTTQRTYQTVQGSHMGTTPGSHAPETSVPTDLPTPPRPQTLERATTSSATTKRTAPAPEALHNENPPVGGVGHETPDGWRKRSRTEHGSHQTVASVDPRFAKSLLGEWLERIEQRLHLYRVPGSLQPLEGPRYKLLYDACMKADPFYILLHQVFCIWSLNRQSAYALLESDWHLVDSSFELLLYALRNNSEISPAHLQWFSSFPLNVDGAAGATRSLQTHSHVFFQINTFLKHFAAAWAHMLSIINSRGYPLMVWELNDTLKCTSPVLQEILFTSSRRRLASDGTTPVHELLRVFALDLKNESGTVDSFERDTIRVNLVERYKLLILQARGDSSQPGYSSNPTTASSPAQGLGTSSSGGPGPPMASYRGQPAEQTHSPVIQQYQAPCGACAEPSSAQGSHGDGSCRPTNPTDPSRFVLRSSTEDIEAPRPTPRPTAVVSSSPVLAQQHAAWQPILPQTTGARQLAAFPSTLVRPGQAARVAPRPIQTWQPTQQPTQQPIQQPTQYVLDPASQYPSPYLSQGAWVGNHAVQQQSPVTPYPLGVQQQCAPVTPYPLGWNARPQQTAPVSQQAMQPWSNNAFRLRSLDHLAVAHDYSPAIHSPPMHSPPIHSPQIHLPPIHSLPMHSPPIQHIVRAPPEQMRPRTAESPTQSQHEVVPLPETEYPQNEHDWSSLRHGLHLVHLRSPRRVPPEPHGRTRYYQFVSHFAVEPRAVHAQTGLRILQFGVSPEDLSKVVRTSNSNTLPVALYHGGSLRYRLRMCRTATPRMRTRDWPISPCFWPPQIYVAFNEEAVYPRRRQHFHHDLPIELSNSLKLGENIVKISLPAAAANVNKTATYFMAVEVVTTLDYAAVRSLVGGSKHCSSDDTRREIARRLSPIDSGDVIVEDDVLCVAVADPFSSILFTIPVRGVTCKHIECFDLKIWLDTRRGKPSPGQGEPSLVDDWKCPICGRDARPVSLRIDDYFAEVRQKLVESGCGGTKKIRIKADGSWTAVQEPDEVENERRSASQARASPRTEHAPDRETAATPIIILDDD